MCTNPQSGLHEPKCVANVGLILAYLSLRGMIDREPQAEMLVGKIREMVRTQALNIDDDERRFFSTPAGELPEQDRIAASWLAEGMGALAWTLRLAELPFFYEKIDAQEVSEALGIFQPGAEERNAQGTLQPTDDVIGMTAVYAALHWRFQELHAKAGPADFVGRVKKSNNGMEYLERAGVRLAGNDVMLEGVALYHHEADRLHEVRGIVMERFRAFYWLVALNRYVTLPPQRVN